MKNRAWTAWGSLFLALVVHASDPSELRASYLQTALRAVRQSPPEQLKRGRALIRSAEAGTCASAVRRLKVECLAVVAHRFCQGAGLQMASCVGSMDVVTSNVLAEGYFVTVEDRYEAMKRSVEPEALIEDQLRRAIGTLAVDLHLASGEVNDDDAKLARQIDRFCLASSDKLGLPWQACASVLIEFIGTQLSPVRSGGS